MEHFGAQRLMDYRFLSSPRIAGDNVYFTVQKARADGRGYDADLHVYRMQTGAVEALTACGRVGDVLPLGQAALTMLETENGPREYHGIGPDENELLFQTNKRFSLCGALGGTRYAVLAEFDNAPERMREDDAEILDEVPFWYNGRGFISGKRSRLYVYDCVDDGLTPVSSPYFEVKEAAVHGGMIAYRGCEYTDIATATDAVWLYDDRRFGAQRELLPGGSYNISRLCFGFGGVLIAASQMQNYGVHENHDIFLLDMQGKIERLAQTDLSIGNGIISDCRLRGGASFIAEGEFVYFIATLRTESALVRMDRMGNVIILSRGGSVDCFDVENGRVFAVCMREMRLQELYELSADGARRISFVNENAFEAEEPARPGHLPFACADGSLLDGWVIAPREGKQNKKHPAILVIHGGPKAAYGEGVFIHEMQLWAERGYYVLFCNPRGSDGRGNAFADLRGKYGTIDSDDILAFTSTALKKHEGIDPGRLYVTGGSYGGFMTNWLIGHTDMFRAAAAQRGISNWLSDFCLSDISFCEAEHDHLATPWSDAAFLWDRSPLKYADRVRTPLLLIHSDLDMHCCMADALQMLTAMKYHGVESRLCLFHGENHDLSRSGKPVNRMRRLREITNWFDSHGGSPTQ